MRSCPAGMYLGILPTGAGKSICFQDSGSDDGGITLVISPYFLMKDQVASSTRQGFMQPI